MNNKHETLKTPGSLARIRLDLSQCPRLYVSEGPEAHGAGHRCVPDWGVRLGCHGWLVHLQFPVYWEELQGLLLELLRGVVRTVFAQISTQKTKHEREEITRYRTLQKHGVLLVPTDKIQLTI